MKRILLAAALAAMVPGGAMAQQMPCQNAFEIHKQLKDKYHELPVALGIQTNGNLLQVYSAEGGATWTVVSTTPAGMSCIVAAGKGLELRPYVKPDPLA